MLVFGTEMHIVTFNFIALEIAMVFYQLIYTLSRPEDKNRMWYMILLFLLIVYNITGGLFPDPQINIPIVTQNIIAYGSGFLMAAYFPYYFYKGFDLPRLRFQAIYGVLLFLIVPYLIFFVIGYSINKNLDLAIEYGIIIPFFYSIILLLAILRAIRIKYQEHSTRTNFMEMVAVYCAVVPWSALTVFAYFHVGQLIEVIFTNGGFLVITIIFISKSITQAKIEYEQLMELTINGTQPSSFQDNYQHYQLTNREIEIVQFIRQGFKYKLIGETLFISERTVTKHVQNIFEKTNVFNRVELLHKLEQQPPLNASI
ncbi:regulatory protein, luxR family [Daejeonella rubra]|uniref:Regulatory protein, luxR family n=1 Tax=Daejeonella rubra TaxID=990371 RepID=A0A1G9XL70_9SPHI|nr:LuxR C-terminal-related transcriptional regulator [Daejeonella rubra]SDM97507.1 regulatory protein, luxR family [Daejeonella rubra]